MPEHTTFFSYLLAMFPALGQNMHVFGHSLFGAPVTAHGAEPLVASLFIMVLLVVLAVRRPPQARELRPVGDPRGQADHAHLLRGVRRLLVRHHEGHDGAQAREAVLPARGLAAPASSSSRTRSASSPGSPRPTSNWNITMGCALVVFVMFNYYGLKENGLGYLGHLFGPYIGWWGIPINLLLFVDRARLHAHPPADAQHPSDAQHGGRPPAGHPHPGHDRALPAHPRAWS